jgi:hypothetical protein
LFISNLQFFSHPPSRLRTLDSFLGPSCIPLSIPSDNDKTCESGENKSADYLALLRQKSPDLALVVERWDSLPEAVKAGIIAMVKAQK